MSDVSNTRRTHVGASGSAATLVTVDERRNSASQPSSVYRQAGRGPLLSGSCRWSFCIERPTCAWTSVSRRAYFILRVWLTAGSSHRQALEQCCSRSSIAKPQKPHIKSGNSSRQNCSQANIDSQRPSPVAVSVISLRLK